MCDSVNFSYPVTHDVMYSYYVLRKYPGGVKMANTNSRQNTDVFVAGIINQKTVNQSCQQVLVLIAAQVSSIVEAQFGFATNDDRDTINA